MIGSARKLFDYFAHSWQGYTEGFLQVVLFTVSWSVKKHYVAKVLLAIGEIFSYKFAFILFLSFLTNQIQESGFKQFGDLVTRNVSVFCF